MIQSIQQVPDFSDLSFLPKKARDAVLVMEPIMHRIDAAGRGGRRLVIQQIELDHGGLPGFDEKSIYRKYQRWRLAGRQRAGLVNLGAQRRLLKRCAVYHAYKHYCENNQRGSRAAWRAMVEDLMLGKSMPHGVGDWRDVYRLENGNDAALPFRCPYSLEEPPKGWTYARLQEAAGLSQFEKTATRTGMNAAREFVLPVLTTRVGLHLGQYLQFDDKWHDAEVNFPGQKTSVRPLEFVCRDVLSAATWARGIRPRIFNEDTGRRENLKEREMRFMAAYILTEVGVYKGGSTWIVEHGTAAFSDTDFERINRIHPGLIRPERSGILAEQVHAGMWAGKEGGNFRLKGLLEGLHSLDHNALAAVAGQVGKGRDNCPEQFKHLSAYNIEVIKAAAQLDPERRAMLQWPLLPVARYVSIAMELYDRLEDRKWHEMQGWSECGFEVAEYRLGEGSNWFPMASLDAMEPAQRAAIAAFIQASPDCRRVRNLSPREVKAKLRDELTVLPLHVIPDILRHDDGFETRVEHDGTIQFQQKYLGPGVHVFHATAITPVGFHQALTPGRKYWVHVTPYQPDRLFISEKDSGVIIGIAPRYDRAPRYDIDAIHSLQGAQAHHRAQLAAPVKARHQDEAEARLALVAHNDAVISGAPATAEEKAAAGRAAKVDLNAELLREQQLLQNQEGASDEQQPY